jgi:hypothetical protein
VAGTGSIDHIQVIFFDNSIEMDVDKVLARRGSPVAQKAGLHMREVERLPEQGVVEQVNLAHRQVIGRAPVGIDPAEQLGLERCIHGDLLGSGLRRITCSHLSHG